MVLSNCSFKNKETLTAPSSSAVSDSSETTTTTTVTTTTSSTTTTTVPVAISGPLPAQNAMTLSVTIPTTTFSNPYYIGNSATPTIRVSGVNSGNRVRLYVWPLAGPYTCITNSGEGVASGSTVDITISPGISAGDVVFVPIADDGAGNDTACPDVANYPAIPYIVYRYAAPVIPVISTVTSSNTDGNYYGTASGPINMTLNFTENVTVTGTPRILLNTTPARYATYVSGSGTQDLLFRYTIVSGDVSADLDYVDANSLGLNSGTIKSTADSTVDATLTLPAPGSTQSLGDQYAFVIQANVGAYMISVVPGGTILAYYNPGDHLDLEVTYSESVTVTGTPQISIDLDGTTVTANYLSGSPGTALIFRYTVVAGDFDETPTLGAAISLNGGTIKSTANNTNAMLDVFGVNFYGGIQVTSFTYQRHVFASATSTIAVDGYGSFKKWGYFPTYSVSGFGAVTYRSYLSGGYSYDTSDVYIQVAESRYSSYPFGCGLTITGKIKCWGRDYTAYGTGAQDYYYQPHTLSVSGRYKQITVGFQHACALTYQGVPYCWGFNGYSEVGEGSTGLANSLVIADSLDTYLSISAGAYHTCGITTNNKIKCWGRNHNYETVPGNNSTTTYSTPQFIDSGTNYQFILASQISGKPVFAITSSGDLRTWGGANANITSLDPGVNYTQVSSNGSSHCAITSVGVVRCWGSNLSGELARTSGSSASLSIPANISDSATAYSEVSVGENHVCGKALATGFFKCWGANFSGQLGIGSITDGKTMTAISSPYTYTYLYSASSSWSSTNSDNIFAKDNIGNWYSWGGPRWGGGLRITPQPLSLPGGILDVDPPSWINSSGALYWMSDPTDSSAASLIDSGVSYTKVRSLYALSVGHKIKHWTNASDIALVDNDDYSDFAVGGNTRCAITLAGALKCWGENAQGSVGNGDVTGTDVALPTVIDSGVSYQSVSISENGHVCAVTTAGDMKCWGYPYSGGVGNGAWNYVNVYSPITVDPGAQYLLVKTIGYSSCGITTSYKLKCWGGELDNGGPDSVPRVPTAYDASTNYVSIIEGGISSSNICAITDTGVTKCMNYAYPNAPYYNYWNNYKSALGYFYDLPAIVPGI